MSTMKIKPDQIAWPEHKDVPDQIMSSGAYHSTSDEQGRCPQCYHSGGQRFLGMLKVDNEDRPTYHCTSCNRAYAEVPAAIKVLMKELKEAGHARIGFEPAVVDGGTPYVPPPQNNYETQQTNYKLDSVNSNLSMLNSTIQNLMYQVQELAQQNNKMMEQLANDPLISMRKKITEFDLK